jgi:hypothetical protein
MPINYVKAARGQNPSPSENWLVWFSDRGIEGCANALLLYGSGEIHLLKTVRVFGRNELDELDLENWTGEDYKKWSELFGTGSAADELRTAYRQFRKLNPPL